MNLSKFIEYFNLEIEKKNLAACHNCCLLAETSCEEFNRLLDRGVLIDKELGFFKNLNNSK